MKKELHREGLWAGEERKRMIGGEETVAYTLKDKGDGLGEWKRGGGPSVD